MLEKDKNSALQLNILISRQLTVQILVGGASVMDWFSEIDGVFHLKVHYVVKLRKNHQKPTFENPVHHLYLQFTEQIRMEGRRCVGKLQIVRSICIIFCEKIDFIIYYYIQCTVQQHYSIFSNNIMPTCRVEYVFLLFHGTIIHVFFLLFICLQS